MENNMNEKKSFNFFGLILVVLLAVGCAVGGYFIGVNSTKEEVKESETDTDTEEKEDEKEEKEPEKNKAYTFVKEHKKTEKIGGKELDMVVYFYQDQEEVTYHVSYPSTTTMTNAVRMDLFVNGEKIINSDVVNYNEDKALSDTFVNTDPFKTIKIDTFKDSKNSDVYFIMNLGEIESYHLIYSEKYLYLFDENGKLFEKFKHWSETGVVGVFSTYDQIGDRTSQDVTASRPGQYKLYNHDLADVHDTYIYALQDGATCDTAVEYKYTIENGKLMSTHSRTFTGEYITGVGQC